MKLSALIAILVTMLAMPAIAYDWEVIPDRLNNPVYSGPSGLSCETSMDSAHIFGSNSGTPFGAGPQETGLMWPGISVESISSFTHITLETTVTLNGLGTGFMYGITLWENASRYVMYGLDYGDWIPYRPSRWIAIPGNGPGLDNLSDQITNSNGPHTCRLEYSGGTTTFWFDDMLIDTLSYPMSFFKLRLGAFARANGDSVDVTYSSINIVPEPSSLMVLGVGGLSLLGMRKRRK